MTTYTTILPSRITYTEIEGKEVNILLALGCITDAIKIYTTFSLENPDTAY